MRSFANQWRADGMILPKQSLWGVHLGVPLLGVVCLTVYQTLSVYPAVHFIMNYYQLVSLVFPIMATWASSIVFEPELAAGGGYWMMTAVSRTRCLTTKLLRLWAMGGLATALTTLSFYGIMCFLHRDVVFDWRLAIILTLLVWCGASFTYLLHTWLNLAYQRNVSFAVAVGELLVAALMLTGLGEKLWFFVPNAWAVRMIPMLAERWQEGSQAYQSDLQLGGLAMIVISLALGLALYGWIQQWSGRSEETE